MSNGNGHRWSKFWWRDHQGDAALRMCSLAARGLWMELLCLAHEATPVGHVLVNGKPPTIQQLASIIGVSTKEVAKLLVELEDAGVFSRADDGTIYSRRMVKDAAASEEGREHIAKRWNGKNTDPPNRGANRVPDSQPTRKPNGEAKSPPSSPPITKKLEADSDPEAKKEDKKELINSSLSYPCSAREDPEPPPAARLAVETVVARLASALESSGKKPNGRAPKMSAIQQQIAIIRGPVLDDEDPPPDAWERPRRGPVDPIRSVAEQLAILRGDAA